VYIGQVMTASVYRRKERKKANFAKTNANLVRKFIS